MTYYAKVIAGGKVVIPAELRREFGIKDGDTLIVEKGDDGRMSITTFDQSVRNAQLRVRAIFGAEYSVDQFLKERRADWGEE